ncbi:hypothetical protein DYB37_009622 [Aphanomyces astaci]|uniref:Uncharacterized protein n=1 Tax=Aphanomyces astaci TaxID=112090 RepID=A0A397FD77_APHAT|nr:hypothetical protein DYB34_003847 [Aphanomyces astaci]RHZ10571.1 hypothetical protein DYB37_009622 [Aphanomyces astaci]RHZ17544.1 hypothetical protein DYB31_003491 [Aphanomyces astaci]RLO06879.1 hypothetical protein DYB28_000760 [Aphanomyces astaci]
MSTRERVVWKKQLRGTLKRTLDALGAIAVHATEHVRNIHDLNLDTLLPDIAVIRRQFPALYPAPANPFKQQEKVWAHVLGALNDELRRMGQPSRKQIPWHALVSGTIGVKARNGTEKRKFDLVNWPAQVPKRKKLDEAQCALLLQNLPAVHVAISDTSLAGEGADDDDGHVGGGVSKEGADEEHDDDATEDGDSPKRIATGATFLAVSVGGTAATIELCIYHTDATAKEERLDWETNLLPLRAIAQAKLIEVEDSSNTADKETLQHVLDRVASGEAAVQGREADVIEMKQSWTEAKDAVRRFLHVSPPPP